MSCVVLLFNKLSARIVSLRKKGRACQPPENLQHWEVAKKPNATQTASHAAIETSTGMRGAH